VTTIACVCDTETTDLVYNRSAPLDRQPQIGEFYGALTDLDTGEISHEIDVLIRPTSKISAESKKITGLDDAALANYPSFVEHAEMIKAMIEEAPVVIFHNAAFDKDMVELEFERLGETVRWPKLFCSVEQTCHLDGCRLSLSNLHELLFGAPFKGAHRARHDVAALIRCLVELNKRGEL